MVVAASSNCRVCHRVLTNPRSINVGMGPVCAKRYGILYEDALRYAESRGSRLTTSDLEAATIQAAYEAYKERLRRRRNNEEETNIPPDQTVQVHSTSRGEVEDVIVEFSDAEHARVTTASGQIYETTANSCTCPHFRHRLQGTEENCRHMEALRIARGQAVQEGQREEVPRAIRAAVDQSLHEQSLRRFSDIDMNDEESREAVLDIWRRNRGFDGTYMSRDDAAWNELQQQAQQEWEYQYENVLGGTNNSFGVEIEFELPPGVTKTQVATALYEADVLDNPTVHGYHSGGRGTGPGYWRLETDGSLNNGLELVSPVLRDDRETWERMQTACEKLQQLGVRVNQNTGGHIHVGISPLDHRTYSWQRLGRIGLAYEKVFYRMGGADSESYREGRGPGRHRGVGYAEPLSYYYNSVKSISGRDSAEQARAKLSGRRYIMMNATNVDAIRNRKPTIEMRYPNSTVDYRQLQAQIQVANAVVHQAAVIRNDSPQNEFTPGFLKRNQQIFRGDHVSAEMEKDHFRKFLDVLGNQKDRLAATWLFSRGRA